MAGTITRTQLVDKVRYALAAWPEVLYAHQAVTAQQSTITLEDTTQLEYLHPKSIIQIDNELMRVIDIPESGLDVRVMRGYMGTTAAAHSIGATVHILPSWGWSDYEIINHHLPAAALWAKPYFWTYQTSDTFTWSAQSLTATLPTNSGISFPDGNALHRLMYSGSDGKYRPFSRYRLLGSTLHFDRPASSATTLKAEYLKFVSIPSSASAAIDLDDAAEAITLYAASLALNSLKTNRVRFAEYSASLNDRASTADELVRMGYDIRNQAVVARDNNGRQPPGDYVATYRNPF